MMKYSARQIPVNVTQTCDNQLMHLCCICC